MKKTALKVIGIAFACATLGFISLFPLITTRAKADTIIEGGVVTVGPGTGGGSTNAAEWVSVPASASASGTEGQIAEDNDYLYICVDTDTWRRLPLAAW